MLAVEKNLKKCRFLTPVQTLRWHNCTPHLWVVLFRTLSATLAAPLSASGCIYTPHHGAVLTCFCFWPERGTEGVAEGGGRAGQAK